MPAIAATLVGRQKRMRIWLQACKRPRNSGWGRRRYAPYAFTGHGAI
jgi:hypothetical protein